MPMNENISSIKFYLGHKLKIKFQCYINKNLKTYNMNAEELKKMDTSEIVDIVKGELKKVPKGMLVGGAVGIALVLGLKYNRLNPFFKTATKWAAPYLLAGLYNKYVKKDDPADEQNSKRAVHGAVR